MLVALITLLIVGWLVWRMIRHPIHSSKVIGSIVGLISLGLIACTGIIMVLVWLAE